MLCEILLSQKNVLVKQRLDFFSLYIVFKLNFHSKVLQSIVAPRQAEGMLSLLLLLFVLSQERVIERILV